MNINSIMYLKSIFHYSHRLFADAMEASQMYCDMPPQSAFNFAGYHHGMPLTSPNTEEEPPAVAAMAIAQNDRISGGCASSKRPAAESSASAATATATTTAAVTPEPYHREPKRPKREVAPSPDIDIVNVAVVRSSSPDVLKPRQEKIWRPYGATDE